ncbi:MAG: HDOD domain-containing protein [Pseudomonadales bacterium]
MTKKCVSNEKLAPVKEQAKNSLLVRLPIYDQQLNIQGYQLRSEADSKRKTNTLIDGATATDILLDAINSSQTDDLLNGKPGFVNFARSLLLESPPPTEKKYTIEIFENIVLDNKVFNALKNIKSNGYTIAMDTRCMGPQRQKIMELVDIVKFDMQANFIDQIRAQLKELTHSSATLLAENIKDHACFNELKMLNFSLFHGDFLLKPDIVKGKKIETDQQTVLRLLTVLQDNGAEFSDIENVISTSSVLSYKLLRLINSPLFGLNGPVESLQQAIMLLGLDQIRSWGSLLALTSLKNKPDWLCMNALIRAEMCKQLADKIGINLRENSLFTAGLISTMDAFFDIPLTDIVNSIRLPSWLKVAVLTHEGVAGLILQTAKYYEQADFDAVNWEKLQSLGLTPDLVQSSYHDSIVWAADITEQMQLK